MTQSAQDCSTLLLPAPDMVAEVMDRGSALSRIASQIKADDTAYESFARACRFEPPFTGSWIHGPGEESAYLSLELAAATLGDDRYRALLADIVLSPSTAIPYDYRAMAAEKLAQVGPGEFAVPLKEIVDSFRPLLPRTAEAKINVPTDGIDHLFDIPDTVTGRLNLVIAASRAKTLESQYLLAGRILGIGDGVAAPRTEAERLISEDVGTGMVSPSDYLVPWDQEFPSGNGAALTLAELMRIVLMCPEFKLPDVTVRPILVDFYRSVLRAGGRSIIGLAAGVFHVEHGTLATPSYYYQGRDAILGKGCVIDCVGGAILQKSTFLGGGFMPILIHTHKHIRKGSEAAASERKQIHSCVFVADAGARYPMSAIGLFETVDFLGKETPYQGIRAIPHGE
ncbi:hypothetical protein FHS29_006999 [Saccharothrix tamanrassetensis]|uniref:Uncharacterized protein n=1 Tax=Saccharothrix tamanrassetensis TaxID=1051531 RepID=A0A841CYH0_9PSEU|nr:hypothetical protein [Saccharothrix tamanrassetensis]MBB5960376.1 hypothetical protein [Saccharothrix tamanrassetensis]